MLGVVVTATVRRGSWYGRSDWHRSGRHVLGRWNMAGNMRDVAVVPVAASVRANRK
jgi:hypothetical protein